MVPWWLSWGSVVSVGFSHIPSSYWAGRWGAQPHTFSPTSPTSWDDDQPPELVLQHTTL